MDAADKPEKAISTTLAHRRHTRRFQSGLELLPREALAMAKAIVKLGDGSDA
jgi:hypothetical protein